MNDRDFSDLVQARIDLKRLADNLSKLAFKMDELSSRIYALEHKGRDE